MVGPDYKKPSVPMTAAFKETDGWKVAQPSDHLPKGRWWEIFGDPELHALVEEVSAANQNLKIAEARLREARAMVRFNRAALFPTISAGLGASSIRESSNRPFLTPNASLGNSGDFLLSLDLSYEVDLWGRVRRTVAAARQEAQATAADLETARLSLQAELVVDYIELRAADAQQQLLEETVKAFTVFLRLTTDRFRRRGRPEVRRRPGPDTARYHPGAVDRHRRAAGAIRARDRDPDRQAAGGVQPAAPASGPPAARHSRRSTLTASRAAPGHRGRRAPGGGSQRADRHRARRVLSDRDAERVGRIRGLDVRQLSQRLEPPVGGGRVDHADDLRRRAAARDIGRDDRRSTMRRSPATARRH